MHRLIPIIPALALAAAGLIAQDENKGSRDEVRRYDVRSLASGLVGHSAYFPFTRNPTPPGGAGEASIKGMWVERETTGPRDVVDLVSFALNTRRDADERPARMEANGGWLSVTASAAVHANVARALATLRRVLGQAIEIEWSILPPEAVAAASSPVLDAAKADRLLEAAKPLAVQRAHIRPGSQTVLEAVSRRAYLKDYDTEIAQESRGYDPLVDVLVEGARASVRVDQAADGGFVIAVEGQHSALDGPMRTRMLDLNPAGQLQLPQTWWTSTSASARLASRGALLVGNDVVPRSAWMFRVIASDSKPADGEDLRFLQVGALTQARLHTHAPAFRSPNPTGGGMPAGADLEPNSRLERDRLVEDIHAIRPEGTGDDRKVLDAGHLIAVAGDKKFVAGAAEFVARVSKEVLRDYAFEVRVGTVPAAGFQVPDAAGLEAFATSLTGHAMTAAIAGDHVVLVGGESHAYLKDRDVEIAQKATVDDPIVDSFFTGFSMSCEAVPADDGRCSLEVGLDYQELIDLASVPCGSKEVPEVELPRIAAVVDEVRMDAALGAWTLLRTAPLDGTDRQLLVLLRVREL